MKTIKLWLTTIATLLCSLTANAHDFEVGGIYYTITSSTKLTVAVTYRGRSYSDYSNEYSGAVTIPSTVTYNSKTYRVTSIGFTAFYDCSSLTSITIPESVTGIGSYAFRSCSSLTAVHIKDIASWCNINFSDDGSNPLYYAKNLYLNGELVTELTIPNSATAIKNYAFFGCSSLTSITIPESVTSIGDAAFYDCSSLTSITIPESVTGIGDEAFRGCSSLTSITIPESVTSIGEYAFSGCSSLTSITVAEGNARYDSRNGCNAIIETSSNTLIAGCSSTVIPESVTSIGNEAFRDCRRLTSITIPENSRLTSIGEDAFYKCSSLTSITIPESVTSIGDEAFYGCSSLTAVHIKNIASWCNINFSDDGSNPLYYAKNLYLNGELVTELTIPNSATAIKNYAFFGCSSLTSITIPESVTSIRGNAFYDCSSLTSITVAEGNARYDSRNGCNAIIETSSNTLIVGCSSTVIPESVTSIGGRAFYNCRSLTSITIPESVTSIGDEAFYKFSSLTSITISENSRLTSIGEDAFYKCSSLTSITIPESVTSIRGNAFYDCSSLTSVHIKDIASWCNIDFTITPYYSVYDSNPLYYAKNLYLNGELVTELTIPNTVTAIKSYAFYNCSSLTSITIPEGVTSIGGSAFYNCSSLHKVINFSNLNISKGSNSHGYVAYYAEKVITADDAIDKYCFRTSEESTHYLVGYYGNDSILNLPEDYHGDDYIIDAKAFAGDARIVSVIIPQTVGEIGASAFAGCSKLVSVTIPRGVMSIGNNAFENCTSLAAIVIPQNMLTIGSKSFAGCSSLASVEFKEGVETIGNNAFANCTSLATLIFPESLTAIGDGAFKGCSGLKTILFSENIDAYGSNVFEGCDAVETMTVKGSVMPTVPSDKITSITLYSPVPLETAEFANKVYRNATVYVPQGSLERYQAASVWKNFWTIKEFDPTGIGQLTIDNGQLTIYDLSGRKVTDTDNLKGGIYIINGRKVLIND